MTSGILETLFRLICFCRANAEDVLAKMEGSAYHYTKMTHISVNVNQMAVGSVEANIARMFSVSNSVYFPHEK